MPEPTGCHPRWQDVSFEDLGRWTDAGSVQRGRDYQRRGAVASVACSETGVLSGRVSGGEVYRTVVSRDERGRLCGECSCPVGLGCKHAVALVLEYLSCVKAGKAVPQAEPPAPPAETLEAALAAAEVPLEEYVAGLGREELQALVLELARECPDVRKRLGRRTALVLPDLPALVAGFRAALEEASAEPGYGRSWSRESYIPDYSLVREYLEQLVAFGEADVVLDLGLELLAAGCEQVEQSDDEGETGEEISSALEPVWEALGQGSLTPAGRLLWFYDCQDEDDYGLAHNPALAQQLEDLAPEQWAEVAAELQQRLAAHSGPEGHRRRHLAERAAAALRRAGRQEEGRDLALQQARREGRYERVVELLLETGRLDEAEAAAREGLAEAESPRWRGHDALREHLRDLAVRRGESALAAAFTADGFFRHPRLEDYRALREATAPLGLWPPVREQTLAALAADRSPLDDEAWPLPPTGLAPSAEQSYWRPSPYVLLTRVALEEGRHDDALRLLPQALEARHSYDSSNLADQVARGVETTHPEEALAIWQRRAQECIACTNPRGYGESLGYLRLVRALLTRLDRTPEWEEYLRVLRQQHRRKRNFIALLDALHSGPILEQ